MISGSLIINDLFEYVTDEDIWNQGKGFPRLEGPKETGKRKAKL